MSYRLERITPPIALTQHMIVTLMLQFEFWP